MKTETMKIPKLRFQGFTNLWGNDTLNNLSNFSKGKGISKSDIEKDGETECIRYGELYTLYNETIEKVFSKTNVARKELVFSESNDVIIPSSGETKIDIAKASCLLIAGIALGGDLNVIKTNLNGVFLTYYLNSQKKKEIASLAQGNSVVHLYSHQLKGLTINFPEQHEQTKIASFLITVDKKLEALKKKKTLLEQYKKGVMQKIFSQELRFKDENGKDFREWEERKFRELGEIVTGKTPSTSNTDLWNGIIQFVTPTDINENKYQ